MANAKQTTKTTQAANKAAKPTNKAAKPAAPAAAPQAAAPAVALRGGPAVGAVVLTGKPYRTAAAHNMEWWNIITKAQGGPVAKLVEAKVPTHFIGYALRRGYLQAA